ncbi:MAG: elongation factor G [Myxococcota bacterium]|nr:elongation factor G [Myxococcota bacterium]
MLTDLSLQRNIGISAHIDSGKTTLTERILFYTGRIHAIHDVRGKDGVGAKMDSMELERERGITIQSAATHCAWKDIHINIIDTPGHVDFTIEVERALRVLDGAVLVLCSVAGVQSQSITVDRQMKRYGVPRVAFVNKCDRQGANPVRVRDQLRDKLNHNAVLMQIPIGLEEKHVGVVDLVDMQAVYFEGENGENIRIDSIPAELVDQANEFREEMLDSVSMFSDELTEAILMEEEIESEMIHAAVREATLKLQMTPVLMGSAYKNRGVQLLLDAVKTWLPSPTEVVNEAIDTEDDSTHVVPCDPEGDMLALAFKLEDGRYGQLTYLRLYQGTVKKGDTIYNVRSRDKIKVGRLVRMHSDEMEEIDEASAGDIIALFGVDCYSGDSFCSGNRWLSMTSIHVPDPVISIAISPVDAKSQTNMSKALQRFTKEDPTFRVRTDEETNETIIAGMGELHLEVYIERMKREYNAIVDKSPPRVSYREAITRRADFNYTHKKQTGGSGQYGRVAGYVEPMPEDGDGNYEFVDQIKGGSIPREFIPSCNKGFKSMLDKGRLIEAPVVRVRVVINDGASHAVDSSDRAFQAAAKGAWREVYGRAGAIVLEPVMKVSVEGPSEFQGSIIGTLNQRRGTIIGMQEDEGYATIDAEVPLAEMFAYSNTLRSSTQGKAEFTMEFARYLPAPKSVMEELIKRYQEEKAAN